MDIKVLELDPLDFRIWVLMFQEAKVKRTRMNCDWTPFINAYRDLLATTKLPKGGIITEVEGYKELLIDYYVNRHIPLNKLTHKHLMSTTSLNKRAEAFMLNFINTVRGSLLPYPCHQYWVQSKEVQPGKSSTSTWITDALFSAKCVAARSNEEAIEIVERYCPEAKQYTLIATMSHENKALVQPAIRFI